MRDGPPGPTDQADHFQVSVSSLSLGTLYEAILDFSQQETYDAVWTSVCRNAKWIFPTRRMCVLRHTEEDELEVVGSFAKGKFTKPAAPESTPAQSKLGKKLLGQPATWIANPTEVFAGDDPVSAWFGVDPTKTVFVLTVSLQGKCIGALLFGMGVVESKDQTMLTALGTVYALHVGMAHALLRMTEERREAQDRLVEAEKMAALGGLVAGIAHEINTPVGIGVTAASHLKDRMDVLLERYRAGSMKRSDLNKFLETADQSSALILSNLDRAVEIISSFKQVAVDQSSEKRRTFAVGEYLHEILVSLRPTVKKTKHEIEVTCDESISLDNYPGAFSQIVTNLLMNSLLHAYEEDDAGKIRFVVSEKPDQLVLRYSDDGRGIAPENLEKIFEPFFTTRRKEGGSGLGLHIVYNLVTQRLGGQIDVKSKVGRGTSFTIRLPRLPAGDES